MPLRRAAPIVIAWVAVAGIARGVVALPERCPPVTAADARAGAVEAVGWMQRNQRPDGRWVYRYDREADAVDLRSHVVRHSGVAMSLYQAHAAGIPGALATADGGVDWSLGTLVRHDDWAAVRAGDDAPTGATALLLAGLAIREAATGDGRFDDEMTELGRFLVAMTEPSGAVAARWDVGSARPVPSEYSPFFTGEAYFALALLAEVDPDGGWEATARRIGRYLATERDAAEDRFPPTSDHWAAYGLGQMARAAGTGQGEDELAYALRLAGIFGVQVRYESQRTGEGLNRWVLRGPPALGAGVGTLGEGLGALWSLAGDPGRAGGDAGRSLAGERDAIAERLRCVAGILVDRQVTAAEAAEAGRPGLARGAWFHGGVTQMDDQQHALSALLAAVPVLPTDQAAAERASPGLPAAGEVSVGSGGGTPGGDRASSVLPVVGEVSVGSGGETPGGDRVSSVLPVVGEVSVGSGGGTPGGDRASPGAPVTGEGAVGSGDGTPGGDGTPSGDRTSPARAVWLALVALAAVNPARVRAIAGNVRPGATGNDRPAGRPTGAGAIAGTALAAAVLVAAALVAGPALDAADVSAPTGLVAAGLVVVLAAAVDAVRRPEPLPAAIPAAAPAAAPAAVPPAVPEAKASGDRLAGAVVPVVVPALVRPAVALLVVAVAADAGAALGVLLAAVAAACGAALLARPGGVEQPASPERDLGRRLADTARVTFAALAIAGGVDLMVHGVLAV